MQALVRSVFARLHTLDPVVEEKKLQTADEDVQDGEIKMTFSSGHIPDEQGSQDVSADNPSEIDEHVASPASQGSTTVSGPRSQCVFLAHLLVSQLNERTLPDGLPSILELLRVLINVLDPNDQQHTDSTRIVALGILNTAFEVSGSRLAEFPSLEALVLDSGCKFLFQLARSDNTSVLHLALRTISTVLNTLRKHLKLQQELFLAFTIDRLVPQNQTKTHHPAVFSNKKGPSASPRPGTPAPPNLAPVDKESEYEKGSATPPRLLVSPARGETRDLILESLIQVTSHPSFMVDLYTNYDCDINCENLFERLIDFLTKARILFVSEISYTTHSLIRASIRRILEPVTSLHNATFNTTAWTCFWRLLMTWLLALKAFVSYSHSVMT
jgi:golgi-specific brefeldin A-resistance guanine nucleotide exchange factor 1